MYIKFIWIALTIVLVLQQAHGKRPKKKHINNETPESTPQPNVLTYSTFGFKDVGSYDGFVPSSPDFTDHIPGRNQEVSTRLYAPAFPSSLEATGLGSYYDPQPDIGAVNIGSDGETNMKNYQPVNFFTSPSQDSISESSKVYENKDTYNINTDNVNSPIYGSKISYKGKHKLNTPYNDTAYNIFGSVSSVINSDATGENNSNNNYPNYPTIQQFSDSEKTFKTAPTSSVSLKFPKVVDFTNLKKYYPTSVDSKSTESLQKPIDVDTFENGISNSNYNTFESNENFHIKESQSYKNAFKDDKTVSEVNPFIIQDTLDNYSSMKNNFKNNKLKYEYKDKVKTKPWNYNNNADESKKLSNSIKGYEYSTNHSTTRFNYAVPKRPFNSSIDEISPASSNLDFVDYQFPEKENTVSESLPYIKTPFNFESSNIFTFNNPEKEKSPEQLFYPYKNLYSLSPTTSTSHWGNLFKPTELTFKNRPRKPLEIEDNKDDIVHIPKRHQYLKYEKYSDNKANEWLYGDSYKSYKPNGNKELYDWTKDVTNTRFKSEEDLLGLRNHDTSKPSYVPYKSNYNNYAEEFDYKKLVDKWKQNYLKAKYRDSVREYETYASEPKPMHVPIPKPYPIEVPHPVIVPVPQPYPVKVPIPKPVAVPVVRELMVPVEKPVPYPVIKRVPYPIEKPVPVPVEKQVRVPVVKPYPIHIPQIRPVFHHTKPHDDRESDPDEDEYEPRPERETNRAPAKRQKNSRYRQRSPPRRPSRTAYQDRGRKRVPSRRPSYHDQRPRRPSHSSDSHSHHRYHEDFEDFDSEPSDFEIYCKRTGKC